MLSILSFLVLNFSNFGMFQSLILLIYHTALYYFNNSVFAEAEVNIVDYSTIFTEPEENNCFSIIAQVINRATVFSFILLVSSLKTSRNRPAAIFEN